MFELTPYERRHQRALFNPFRDMENFEKNFWGDMAATDFKTDIKDNGKEYVLEAELPGFKKEDVQAELKDGYHGLITGEYKDGVLTLTMPKKEENVPTSRRIEIG